ncbi:tetratricopeptide repeat protein [Allokutzneria oryzae]|uniref:Tol-pal system YbgF family protein n=1 Tax=Allokutzneria oryzae TaxID=1378989 RepID=A0ABV6A3M7_9PSEU
MDHPTQAVLEPAPVARSHDSLAVALGNASLLGVGYVMMGRRKLFVVTGLVTIALVVLLVSVRSVWVEVLLLVWWAALIAHGWSVAGGRGQRVVVRRQRLIALGITVAVLLAVALLRFDAARIERTVTEARQSGDCARAVTALDGLWLGHRVADAPMTARGGTTIEACQRLRMAKDKLSAAVTGDIEALKAGFAGLAAVLAQLPGHERMVEVVLDGFLGGLPAKNPCHTVEVTDWLRQRQASNNALDRSVAVIARTAPAALVGCADTFMGAKDWQKARALYQRVPDQFPGHELTAKAQEGVKQATLAIELATVRGLLRGSTSTEPAYCSRPARYSGAAAQGAGTNRALIYGNEEYTSKLPAEWRATDAADAVLVVCVGAKEFGTPVRTCPYQNKLSRQFPTNVTFHKIAIPVKVYELRTGNVVADTKVEIDGASCPKVLTYSRPSGLIDIGPPSKVYVTASDDDVRGGFSSLINR